MLNTKKVIYINLQPGELALRLISGRSEYPTSSNLSNFIFIFKTFHHQIYIFGRESVDIFSICERRINKSTVVNVIF